MVVQSTQIMGVGLANGELSDGGMLPLAGLTNAYDADFDEATSSVYYLEHPVTGDIVKTAITKTVSGPLRIYVGPIVGVCFRNKNGDFLGIWERSVRALGNRNFILI